MIETMSTVHMNENEVTANFADVLEKVRHGVEVIVERNHQLVAIIRSPKRSGLLISECIASAKASGSKLTLELWMRVSPKMSKTESASAASHGIRHPGISPQFQHHHRG